MLAPGQKRLFALACSLSLGLVLAVFSYGAFASAPQVTIYTPHPPQTCTRTGRPAPTVFQGETFLTSFDYYRVLPPPDGGPERIEVDITFPDGRIFTFFTSQALDGVIDMPVNDPVGSRFATNGAGQRLLNIAVPGTWPYGCYRVTGWGVAGAEHIGTAEFVVAPGGAPGPTGGFATLRATRNGQEISTAQQGDIVEVDGRNFVGGEWVSVWITAPDGTVIDMPPGQGWLQATPGGAISTSFQFEGKNPVGTYTFTAEGQTSGSRVFATFTLTPRPVVQGGPAQLSVVVPEDRREPQRTVFYINGNLFWPGETVSLWLTLPDGSVRGFPQTMADPLAGQFMVELALDERLPIGFYQLTAEGTTSRQLKIATFNLQQTTRTEFNPDPSPSVGLDNNPATPPDEPFADPNLNNENEFGNPDE